MRGSPKNSVVKPKSDGQPQKKICGVIPVGVYSCRVKLYGSEPAEVMIFDQPVFNGLGVDNPRKSEPVRNDWAALLDDHTDKETGEVDRFIYDLRNESTKRAKRRARTAVFDYAMCNPDLNLFLTLTFSPEIVNRYDYSECVKKFNTFFDNRVRRNGCKYVAVAEHHKDGAIHFHALTNAAAFRGEMVNSGKKDKRRHVVYNVSGWKYGFSTAIRTYGERANVCKYVCKYISKGERKVGGRWYYHGGSLITPNYLYLNDPDKAAAFAAGGDFDYFRKEIIDTKRICEIYSRLWRVKSEKDSQAISSRGKKKEDKDK